MLRCYEGDCDMMLFIAGAVVGLAGLGLLIVGPGNKPAARAGSRGAGGVLLLTGIALAGAASIVIVAPGTVRVASLFGKVQEDVYGEGLHVVNPLMDFHEMSVRRQMYNFTEGNELVSISQDGVRLQLDVAFPIRLNPELAWKVFQTIGPEQRYLNQLSSAARTTVRDVVALYDWKSAATTKRQELAQVSQETFKAYLRNDLVSLGFTEAEADRAFSVLPVQLRRVLPPEKVLNAISEKVASEEDLERQKTLTAIAEEAALRRANEGLGVKKLFAELPEGFSAEEISTVLNALAQKEKANALLKAVETDQVKVIVMEGGSPAAVSVPATPQ